MSQLVILFVTCAFGSPVHGSWSANRMCSRSVLPQQRQDIYSQISNLRQRMMNLLAQTIDAKSYIQGLAYWSSMELNYLNTRDISSVFNMALHGHTLNSAITEPTEALLLHREQLLELAVYTEECRTTGSIRNASGTHNLKTKLWDIETDIHGAICTLDTALVKQQIIVDATRPPISAHFISGSANRRGELGRAYVLMNYGESLFTNLTAIYAQMSTSLRPSDNHA